MHCISFLIIYGWFKGPTSNPDGIINKNREESCCGLISSKLTILVCRDWKYHKIYVRIFFFGRNSKWEYTEHKQQALQLEPI